MYCQDGCFIDPSLQLLGGRFQDLQVESDSLLQVRGACGWTRWRAVSKNIFLLVFPSSWSTSRPPAIPSPGSRCFKFWVVRRRPWKKWEDGFVGRKSFAEQPLLCWSLASSLTGREETTTRMSRKRTRALAHLH
jgi:hypothetical protein